MRGGNCGFRVSNQKHLADCKSLIRNLDEFHWRQITCDVILITFIKQNCIEQEISFNPQASITMTPTVFSNRVNIVNTIYWIDDKWHILETWHFHWVGGWSVPPALRTLLLKRMSRVQDEAYLYKGTFPQLKPAQHDKQRKKRLLQLK